MINSIRENNYIEILKWFRVLIVLKYSIVKRVIVVLIGLDNIK